MTQQIPKPVGRWTALKLEYLDHYLQAYKIATKRAQETYYIDLFAGCGDCTLRRTGWPVDGSPWRALKTIPPFTRYFFVEKNAGLAAHLKDRITRAGVQNADVFTGDCNGSPLDEILTKVPRYAPSFAFLDPSGLQLHWTTVKRLAVHRLGPFKMELLILYPYDMVIKRWISMPSFANALTAFYGDEAWRSAQEESVRLGEDDDTRQQRFVNLYKEKVLGLGYKYVDAYGPLGYRHRRYYHVIFAGDQPTGQKIMRDVWSKPRAIPDQLGYTGVKRPQVNRPTPGPAPPAGSP